MRIVDIYREDGSRLLPVAFDCIQLYEGGAVLTRAHAGKLYTMANGAPFLYQAERDKATAAVQLECTGARAQAIGQAVHFGKLVLAGLGWGTERISLPPAKGKTAYLTGGVQIEQKYAGTDIFRVSLPVWLETADSGSFAEVSVPAVSLGSLEICGETETLKKYRYSEKTTPLSAAQSPVTFYAGVGSFFRKNVFFTNEDTFRVEAAGVFPDGLPEETVKGIFVQRDGVLTALETGSSAEFVLPLHARENHFLLCIYGGAVCKPLILQFAVYRMG